MKATGNGKKQPETQRKRIPGGVVARFAIIGLGRAVRMVCGTYGGCWHAGDAADAFPADCFGDSGICASL